MDSSGFGVENLMIILMKTKYWLKWEAMTSKVPVSRSLATEISLTA